MRNWASIFILFLTSISFAWNYEYHPLKKYNGLDIYEISGELRKNSFFEMDLTRSGRLSSLDADQIYLNEKNKDEFALVIFDLVSPTSTKLNLSGDQVVCHSKTSQGRSFAVYFSNRKLSEGISFCESSSSAVLKKVFTSLVPAASAMDCSTASPEATKNIYRARDAMIESSQWLLQKMGTCLLQAKSGGEDVVEGFSNGVDNFGKNIKNLTSMTPEKMWSAVSEKARAFKTFVTNISAEVKNLVNNFKNLDAELIMAAVCKTAGESFASGLMLAGVAGIAAKLAVSAARFAMQLKGLVSVFERLNHMKAMGRIDLANGILSCAVK